MTCVAARLKKTLEFDLETLAAERDAKAKKIDKLSGEEDEDRGAREIIHCTVQGARGGL